MLRIELKITDEDGHEYSVGEILKLFTAIKSLNDDEQKVNGKEAATLFPVYCVQAFPINQGRGEWQLDEPRLARYKDAFPGVDVPAELNRARSWLLDNPSRQKTAKGMARFLSAWLKRRHAEVLDRAQVRQPMKPTENGDPKPIDASHARFQLVKMLKIAEARDWSDEQCVAEYLLQVNGVEA